MREGVLSPAWLVFPGNLQGQVGGMVLVLLGLQGDLRDPGRGKEAGWDEEVKRHF